MGDDFAAYAESVFMVRHENAFNLRESQLA
jgi:hypothetical protein